MVSFSDSEKAAMLQLKGVGLTVISRLEQLGFSSMEQLASERCEDLTKQIAAMMGSTCWHNSPQARNAIQAIIDLAKKGCNK